MSSRELSPQGRMEFRMLLLSAYDHRFLPVREREVLVGRAIGESLEEIRERLGLYATEAVVRIDKAAIERIRRDLADTPPGFYIWERFS